MMSCPEQQPATGGACRGRQGSGRRWWPDPRAVLRPNRAGRVRAGVLFECAVGQGHVSVERRPNHGGARPPASMRAPVQLVEQARWKTDRHLAFHDACRITRRGYERIPEPLAGDPPRFALLHDTVTWREPSELRHFRHRRAAAGASNTGGAGVAGASVVGSQNPVHGCAGQDQTASGPRSSALHGQGTLGARG